MFNTKVRSQMALEQVRNTEIYKTVRQHWMQALIVVGLCFIILKKDIQIQLNLSSASSQAAEQLEKKDDNLDENSAAIKPAKHSKPKPKVEPANSVGLVQTSDSDKVNQLAMIAPGQLWSMLKDKVMENGAVASIPDQASELPSTAAPKVIDTHTKQKPKSKKRKSGAAPVGNNYSYLTFVLGPTYAKRKGIPQSVVDEKLGACQDYIKRFAPVAISERKKYGVPASIKLAQALLESNSGASRLAQENNNHFGIKCFLKNCGEGHCRNFTDDSHKDFFRNYPNNWESYRAHSLFLQRKRYKGLQKLGVKDYKGWAHGLKKAGYATDEKYAEKLIRIIEFFNLDDFDG